jgi:hypothetical protein
MQPLNARKVPNTLAAWTHWSLGHLDRLLCSLSQPSMFPRSRIDGHGSPSRRFFSAYSTARRPAFARHCSEPVEQDIAYCFDSSGYRPDSQCPVAGMISGVLFISLNIRRRSLGLRNAAAACNRNSVASGECFLSHPLLCDRSSRKRDRSPRFDVTQGSGWPLQTTMALW